MVIRDHGIPGIVLMRRAGAAAFEALRRHWPAARSLTVLCGRGNNAGDGYVIAGIAVARGYAVQLLQVTDAADLDGDAARARDWALGEGVRIETFTPAAELRGELVVDALLGTGLRGTVRPEFVTAIEAIAAAGRPVLAVDLPSGLSADTGAVLGHAVRADLTVTFIGLKRGLLTGAGPAHAGRVRFEALGIPEAVHAAADAPPWLPLLRLGRGGLTLPRRARDAHKGAFGHVLVAGGDLGTGGAVIMAAEAALRSGAGLVSAATRGEHLAPLLARLPEVMVGPVATRAELAPLLARATVVVLGPGLGTHPWGEQLFDAVLEAEGPRVVDADALNLLARRGGRRDDWVLTPHPGEAARLLGTDTATIADDRFAAVQALQTRYGGVVVLKGSGTLVADAHGVALCAYGNPGMASGGMGDVLAGIVGGLVAQGLSPSAAAHLGVCLHGAAADTAAAEHGERALVATDLMGPLAQWLVRIEG
ncbi:MAG TPA: NAD(P)H-hydrate dehydratase [Pseudomonadales bacterium]|nr:NAD(P)H-hydrate dehydratase [Pseudomonadales bacterium]